MYLDTCGRGLFSSETHSDETFCFANKYKSHVSMFIALSCQCQCQWPLHFNNYIDLCVRAISTRLDERVFLSLLASIIGIQTHSAELPWVRFLLTNSGPRFPWGGRMLRPSTTPILARLSGTRETARTTKSTKTVLEFIAMAAFAEMIWRQRWGWTVAREAWRSKFEFAWRHICMFVIFAGRYCQPPPQGHPRVRPDKWPWCRLNYRALWLAQSVQ